MTVMLQIDTSVDSDTSRTRRITAEFAEAWRGRGDDHTVVARDLHQDPPPVMVTSSQHWPERLRGGAPLDTGIAAAQQAAIDDLLAADVVVIGVPMYNYAMPTTLKAWVDLIHVPGVTAPFDVPSQPLAGKHVVLVGARGATNDDDGFVRTFGSLEQILGTGLGMQVHTVTTSRTLAEKVPALDVELAAAELDAALAAARELAATL